MSQHALRQGTGCLLLASAMGLLKEFFHLECAHLLLMYSNFTFSSDLDLASHHKDSSFHVKLQFFFSVNYAYHILFGLFFQPDDYRLLEMEETRDSLIPHV